MNRKTLLIASILSLAVACSTVEQLQLATLPAEPLASAVPTLSAEQSTLAVPTETAAQSLPTPTTCASEDINKLGQSIAEDYPFVTAEEVMTWFCNGADLEDILVALASEDETGTPAEEMLVMRAEGLSWEEIWQIVGFSE